MESPYLGFSVHRDGHKSSVTLTIKLRTAKAWGKVASIKRLTKHLAIIQFGWLRAAQCLVRAIIRSVMTINNNNNNNNKVYFHSDIM